MPTNSETLNRQLYQLLSKYKPKPLDATGKATPVPDEADIFKFEFTKDGEDYGTVFVTLDEDRVLTVYFGDDVTDSPEDKTPGLDYDDSWSGLLHQLSSFRMTRGLKGFDTKNKDQVNDDMARRNHMRNKDKIAEGYYPMGRKASYSDAIPTVKIVIEHSRVIEEGEKRYRNINKIFLENQEGERYLLDTKKPGVARVYARHIAEGGKVNDDRWNHVHSLCEEYQKMAGFVRATRNGQFNESAQSLVNEGIAHYASLRESLSRMTGKRGYNAYFESWTPALMEDEGDETNLNELFVQETLDPRIESVMPILNRIHKKIGESVVDKQLSKLEEWADSLTEEESIKSNNPVGIPEEELEEGFMDTIKKGYNKAVNTLGNIGIMPPELLSPRRDANGNWNKRTNEPRNNFIFWIEQNPGLEPHQAELLASFDKWVDDGNSDRDAGKQAVEMWKQKMKATKQSVSEPMRTPSMTEEEMNESEGRKEIGQMMADDGITYSAEKENEIISKMVEYMKKSGMDSKQIRYLLNYDEDYIADQLSYLPKEGMDESALQAYLGDKKYGKDGMDALRKAGREHAGKEKMQKIRAKFSNKEEEVDENFINTDAQAVVSEEDAVAEGILDSIKNMFKPKDPTPVTPVTSVDIVTGYKTDPEFKAQIDQIAKQQGMTPQALIAHIKQGLDAGADVIGVGEGTHTQHDRDLNPNDYERPPTDWSTDPIEAGTDRIHQKIASVLKRLSKPAAKPLDKSKTDIGSVLEAALPWEDDEEDKDDKKPKDTKGSDGSEHGGHSRAKHLAKNAIPKEKEEVNEMDKSQTPPGRDGDPRPGPERVATPISKEKMIKHALGTLNKSMDKKDDKKEVKEGQEDLDAILRIIRK